VNRSLTAATVATPAAGAAALRLPAWVILAVALTELIALLVLRVSELHLQRQGSNGACEIVRMLGGAAQVTVHPDGGFDVRRDLMFSSPSHPADGRVGSTGRRRVQASYPGRDGKRRRRFRRPPAAR
jgi:hypothetical protein